MKKTIFSLAMLSLVAASCSDKEDLIINPNPDDKEMISFSMTDEAGAPAVAQTRAGFGAATRIVMRMRSKDASSNYRYTRTIAQANAEASGKKYSDVFFDGSNMRYWDDAFGRAANISVFALAIPNKNDATLLAETKLTGGVSSPSAFVNGTEWFTEATENETTTWSVETSQQTTDKIANEDLTYSNNIQPVASTDHDGVDGVYTYDFSAGNYTPTLADDISNLSSLEDGVMKFQLKNSGEPTGIGKFNKGHLIFKHALTRMTIHIKKGTGVTNENTFAFKTNTDIELKQVPVSGTFNIETGKWTITAPGNISRLASMTADASEAYKFQAQFVPGYKFRENASTAADNVMEFTIDDNTYYITQAMIYKALTRNADDTEDINASEKESDGSGNYVEMKQGKNYDLTITVNKKQIETITATLIDWVPVTGSNMEGSNSYVELSLMDPTSTACDHFDLYRVDAGFDKIYTDQNGVTLPTLTNWEGNYTDKATLTHKGSGIWSTNWYWESNKAFYHIRSIDKEMNIQGTGDATNDYINVYSGPVNNTWATTKNSVAVNDLGYNDYHWGAPMKKAVSPATDNLTYNPTTGYASYIHPAIGSTKDQINMIEQHMMANIHIVLHTGKKADGSAVEGGKVTLKDASDKATLITLTNFVGNGKVDIGNGLVTANGTVISSDIPVPGLTPAYTSNKLNSITGATDANYYSKHETEEDVTVSYNYRVVPQALYHGTGNPATDNTLANFIGLTLVTPDNNQYYMVKKLYEVKVSTVSTNHGKVEQKVGDYITYWYPGYDYTYHIYLNKKDIEAITCTVADWVYVVGSNKDITLED